MNDAIATAGELPELPSDWVPEGTRMLVIGRYRDGKHEVMMPGYSIASQGSSREEAIEDAFGLLELYFRACAADGEHFKDARRPMPLTWTAPRFALALLSTLVRAFISRLRRPRDGASGAVRRLEYPGVHAVAH